MTQQERVLAHLGRYRMTTTAVLDALYFPEAKSAEARKSVVKELTRRGYLDRATLFAEGREVYYHLTPAGAVHLGFEESFGGPVRDLLRHYARLLFCCTRRPRPKFTAAEFERAFPGLLAEGTQLSRDFPTQAYYLDEDERGVRRLGRILDVPGRADVRVCREALERAKVSLPELVADNRFALALVTATEGKAKELRALLSAAPLLGELHLRVVVEVYPDLLRLVELDAERRHAAGRTKGTGEPRAARA